MIVAVLISSFLLAAVLPLANGALTANLLALALPAAVLLIALTLRQPAA